MHVPSLLPPLLVVQLRAVAVVLPAVSLALSFYLSPLVAGLLLPLPVLLPADRVAAALQVPNTQNQCHQMSKERGLLQFFHKTRWSKLQLCARSVVVARAKLMQVQTLRRNENTFSP